MVGIVPGSEPAWVAPVTGINAAALESVAYVIPWKRRSSLASRLLVGGCMIYIIGTLIATGCVFGPVFPGPIVGIISGTGILGLGTAKVSEQS